MNGRQPGSAPEGRSTFVTALAWSFIVLGVVSVAWGLVQFLVIQVFVDQEALRAGMRTEHSVEKLPEAVRFILSNIKLLATVMLVASAAMLWISIGLLQRRNWARWGFIALMVLAAAGHLAPLAGGAGMVTWATDLLSGAGGGVHQSVSGAARVAWLVFAVLNLLLAAVFAWIGWKLTRPEVRAEFRR